MSGTSLTDRPINHVVVLGANGTMGYGSGALFTTVVPKVTFLARTQEKAEQGLSAAIAQVRSPSVGSRVETGSYDADFERVVGEADLIFEAVTEDLAVKREILNRIDQCRREDSIVATVTSGLSINQLAKPQSASFRANFLGLHFFNPPNVIVGTELIPGEDTSADLVDFIDAFATEKLGRVMTRTADTPAFAGNRVGFKVLNEVAQMAEDLSPLLLDKLVGPYTGRALSPLATIDLVGWDIHKAIVDNIFELTSDEVHDTLRLPASMRKLIESGTLGAKSGGGFFRGGRKGKPLEVLDLKTGNYGLASDVLLPELPFISEVAALHHVGRYAEAMTVFAEATGDEAALAQKVIAGYIAYSFARVGECTESIGGIDEIMGYGFNWAPPSVLVDTIGMDRTVIMIEKAGLSVPKALRDASKTGGPLLRHPTLNVGKFFVAG